MSGATLFDEDESPVGRSAGKGSKTDSSLERLLNDEEEVPEPMPIAFMAAPEAQGEGEQRTGSYTDGLAREISSAPKAHLGQLKAHGKLRSPQPQEGYTSSDNPAGLQMQKITPPKSQVAFMNRKKMGRSQAKDEHCGKGSAAYGEDTSASLNGELLQRAQPVTSIVNFVDADPDQDDSISPARLRRCKLDATLKVKVIHNIKEHRFVDLHVETDADRIDLLLAKSPYDKSPGIHLDAVGSTRESAGASAQLNSSKKAEEMLPAPGMNKRPLAWQGFLGVTASDQTLFTDIELDPHGFLQSEELKIEKALLQKIQKTRDSKSRIATLKFQEYTPEIFLNFILPYIRAYNLSFSTANYLPNPSLIEMTIELLSLSSESPKLQHLVSSNWPVILKLGMNA